MFHQEASVETIKIRCYIQAFFNYFSISGGIDFSTEKDVIAMIIDKNLNTRKKQMKLTKALCYNEMYW